MIVAIESHQGTLYMQISTIGLDIAKNVFQVHGIDAAEKVVVRKRLPPAARIAAHASNHAVAFSHDLGQTQTLSLGTARPLPPSADMVRR